MPQRNDIIELVPLNLGGTHQLVVSFRRRSPEEGLPPHSIVGMVEVQGGSPKWQTWRPNRPFIDFFCRYMKAELAVKPPFLEEDASVSPGENFFVIDQRTPDPRGEVPSCDIVGAYRTDPQGRPLAETFQYNPNYRLILEGGSFGFLLSDERLYQAVIAYNDASFLANADKP